MQLIPVSRSSTWLREATSLSAVSTPSVFRSAIICCANEGWIKASRRLASENSSPILFPNAYNSASRFLQTWNSMQNQFLDWHNWKHVHLPIWPNISVSFRFRTEFLPAPEHFESPSMLIDIEISSRCQRCRCETCHWFACTKPSCEWIRQVRNCWESYMLSRLNILAYLLLVSVKPQLFQQLFCSICFSF